MILGPDGKKLSKRHGATSVEEYRDRGFLPDAMVNFLALLGWSLDGETTIMSRDVICSQFSLDRITKKDAIFDETKLSWMNGQYIQKMGAAEWVELSKPWLARAHAEGYPYVHTAIVPSPDPNAPADDAEAEPLNDEQWAAFEDELAACPAFYEGLYPLVAERETSLAECEFKLAYMFWGPCVLLDEKSVNKVLKKEGARADEAIAACREVLADEANSWEAAVLEEKCRALAEPLDLKLKNLLQPLRVAICGNMVSPPLFESIELMKREDVLARIDATVAQVF
jgi:glutamyl-tRNA synthetase